MVNWRKGLPLSSLIQKSFGENENISDTLTATNNSRYTGSHGMTYPNYQNVILHLPTIVFLGILSIVGIFGNVLVLHIYSKKMKASNHRIFIIYLAAIDLTVCATSIPFIVYSHMFQLREKWLCKISITISYTMVFSSILILLVIAVERYRKICKPLQRQMSILQAKVSCAIVIVISSCAALPVTWIFGLNTFQNDVDGLTGTRCFVDDKYVDTNYFVYISLFMFFVVFIIFVILSILYYFVSQKIRQRNIKMDISNEKNMREESYRTNNNSSTMFNVEQNIDPIQETNTSTGKNTFPTGEEIGDEKEPELKIRYTQRNRKTSPGSRRTIVMLFTISVVFFVSYFPHIILQLTVSLHNDFEQNLGEIQYCIYDFFNWSFFINNMVNPIIYGACDKRFISEVKKLCHARVY